MDDRVDPVGDEQVIDVIDVAQVADHEPVCGNGLPVAVLEAVVHGDVADAIFTVASVQ